VELFTLYFCENRDIIKKGEFIGFAKLTSKAIYQ
jgi:hypothetical protein